MFQNILFIDLCQSGQQSVELSPILMRKNLTLGHLKDNINSDGVFDNWRRQHPVDKNQVRIRILGNGRPSRLLRSTKLSLQYVTIWSDGFYIHIS